jgi:hypothetical protein
MPAVPSVAAAYQNGIIPGFPGDVEPPAGFFACLAPPWG